MSVPTVPTVLCSISTRGRYDTTLPLAIQSVISQTQKVDKLIIFDDNDDDKKQDVREKQVYQYLFLMLQEKGIKWEWSFAEKKGQHYNHQRANKMGYDFVWRLDDDTVAEANVLENLYSYIYNDIHPDQGDIGAVGGSVLTPPFQHGLKATGKIEDIYSEPNLQWDYIKAAKEVDHLHCSFLYRAGVFDYELALSRVAHREETMFTYGLKQKGYKVLIVPNTVTWHLRNNSGGIRDGQQEMFEHDEALFRRQVELRDSTIVVLDNGLGDHIVFKHVLPEIKNPIIFSCYPEVIPGRSIQEAKDLFGSIDRYNIYQKMDQWGWTLPLEDAFRKLYTEGAFVKNYV